MNKFCNQGSLILLSLGLLRRIAVGCERLLGIQMMPTIRIIIRLSHWSCRSSGCHRLVEDDLVSPRNRPLLLIISRDGVLMFVCFAFRCCRCICFLLAELTGLYYVELVIVVLRELQWRDFFTKPIWLLIRWLNLGHLSDVDEGWLCHNRATYATASFRHIVAKLWPVLLDERARLAYWHRSVLLRWFICRHLNAAVCACTLQVWVRQARADVTVNRCRRSI